MAELHAGGYALLRDLLECLRRRDTSFERKLTTIARHTAIDHVRTHAEYVAGPTSSRWVRHVALSDALPEERPDAVRHLMVDEILTYAEHHLPPQQYEALVRWAAGEHKDEIAEALGLADADAAMRLVRAAQWRLRNHFARAEGEGGAPPIQI